MAVKKYKPTSASYDYSSVNKSQLPDKIRCVRCSIVKNQHAFSGKRLKDLQDHRKNHEIKGKGFNAATEKVIACTQCTGGQVVELHCNGCDKVKGINSFTKAQRKNPDKAECWACVQVRLNTEPGASSSSGSGSGSDDDSDDDSTYGGASTFAETLSTLSINNQSSTAGGVTVGSSDGASGLITTGSNASGGVNVAPSAASSTVTTRTGINSNVGSPHNSTPPHLRRGPASVTSNASSNFAKIRAVPKKVVMDAAERERQRELEEEQDDVTVQDSDSDSD